MRKVIKAVATLMLTFAVVCSACTKDPENGGSNNGNGSGSANGHGYVDLGLASGILWATCNVGASTPEGYGDYFAWGETQLKEVYNWDSYKYYNGTSFTKYNESDGFIVLQPMDDAATANWGSGWRIPTKVEWEELINNTTVTWMTKNGINGWKFTASNGNSLFLPAAGGRLDGELDGTGAGFNGHYWSSSLASYNAQYAWYFTFIWEDYWLKNDTRYPGFSVRPVREN